MNYIIGRCPVEGILLPVVFGPEATYRFHVRALEKTGYEVVSVGKVRIENGQVLVGTTERSKSMGLSASPEDAVILTLFLRYGLTGKELLEHLEHHKSLVPQ